jgi:tetratricopeptide (TPR) repeat protein
MGGGKFHPNQLIYSPKKSFCFQLAIYEFCNSFENRYSVMAEKLKNKKARVEEDEIIYEEAGGKGAAAAAGSADGVSFLKKYQNYLLGGLLLIVVVVFLGGRMGLFGDNPEKVAQDNADMLNAAHYYEADSMNRAIAMFSDLEGGMASKKGENLVKFYLGTAYLAIGNHDEAISYLEDYKKKGSMLSAGAYAALGYAYEEKGEFETAAKMFETAASMPEENDASTPWLFMEAGRCYESVGNKDAALKLYVQIKNDYGNSEEAQYIDRYIGRLNGGAAE